MKYVIALALVGAWTSFVNAQPLEGEYAIGDAGGTDYPTVAAAVADLEAEGISDDVIFTFKDLDDTIDEQVTIGPISGTSASNQIIFDGGGQLTWEYSGATSSTNWIVRMAGADYVTFVDIDFVAATPGNNYGRIFDFDATATVPNSPSEHNLVVGCALTGFLGINSDDTSLIYETSTSLNNRFNEFRNLDLTNGFVGIDFLGSEVIEGASDTTIRGNSFSNQTRGAIRFRGVDSEIRDNTSTNSIVATGTYIGIEILSADVAVYRNEIDLSDGKTGIEYDVAFIGTTDIYNNLVSIHTNVAEAGMIFANSANVYHNTVRMDNAGATTAALRVDSGNPLLKNNILVHANGGFALETTGVAQIDSDSDYNNYFSTGSNVVRWQGTNRTLAQHQAATGRDLNSVSKAVVFVNVGVGIQDLRLDGSSLGDFLLIGTPIAGITTDIDNQPRDPFNPYMGGDEGISLGPLDNADNGFAPYTVGGSGADFTDVTEAILNLNGRGVKGSVTFSIHSGTYPVNEVIDFERYDGATSTTVLFRATNSAVPPVLQHAATNVDDNWIIKVQGENNLKFEDLVFEPTGTSGYSRALVIASGSDEIVVQECAFNGVVGESNTNGSLLFVEGPGTDHEVVNSSFTGGYAGIETVSVLSDRVEDLSITGSTFSNQTENGVRIEAQGVFFEGNESTNGVVASGSYAAFYFNLFGFFSGNQATGNEIHMADGAVGIRWSGNGVVANNMVALKSSIGAAGIDIAVANIVNVFHNTVRVWNAGSSSSALRVVSSGGVVTRQLKNNILYNASGGYALDDQAAAFVAPDSDYNNLFTTGTNVARIGSTNYATLDDIPAVYGNDNAVSTTVTFADIALSPYDLRLAGGSIGDILLVGTGIPAVPEDIDGDARAEFTPYMGADEASVTLEPLDNADTGSGHYTVGGTAPDFSTPEEAIDNLNQRGIKGPVTFIVRDDTYTVNRVIAFVRFGDAASALDEVRFEGEDPGNKPVFEYNSVDVPDNWIIKLDGTDYVIFEDIFFSATGSDDFARNVVLEGDADANQFLSCVFSGVTGIDNFNAALVISESIESDDTVFENNQFDDGAYGLYLRQSGETTAGSGTRIEGNTFSNQATTAITTNHDDAVIKQNTITSTLADTGVELTSPGRSFEVSANEITLARLTPKTGIRIVDANNSSIAVADAFVVNNFVSSYRGIDMGATIGPSSTNVYHNSSNAETIALDVNSTASDIEVVNNILIRTGPGDSPAFSAASSTITVSDYNVIHNQTGNDEVSWGGTEYFNFEDYQNASGQDANSVTVAVTFVDANNGDLHLSGTSVGDISLGGTPLAVVAVDIDGESRGTVPYVGADEVSAEMLGIEIAVDVYLSGPYDNSLAPNRLRTDLNDGGILESEALDSPYSVAPWNCDAASVASGFFAAHPSVVDWVCLELRTGDPLSPPMTSVAAVSGLLLSDGSVVSATDAGSPVLFGITKGTYYAVVHHRNHLSIMTSVPLDASDGSGTYDFRLNDSDSYGTGAQELMPGIFFAMWSGDADSDGNIFPSDLVNYWIVQSGSSGYREADFDMDGNVFPSDLVNHWIPNAGLSTKVPDP